MCLIASGQEIWQAAWDKDGQIDTALNSIYEKIGGKENYAAFVDGYCACKARRVSEKYKYDDYMMDTVKVEGEFVETKENTACSTETLENMKALHK